MNRQDSVQTEEEYIPGWRANVLWFVFAAGLVTLGFIFDPGYGASGEANATDWLLLGALVLILLFGPSRIQYLLLRRFGAQPTSEFWNNWPFGTWWIAKVYRFTREQFAIVCAAPAPFTWTICLLFIFLAPRGEEVALPLSFGMAVFEDPSGSR